jgi:hypothetical protein
MSVINHYQAYLEDFGASPYDKTISVTTTAADQLLLVFLATSGANSALGSNGVQYNGVSVPLLGQQVGGAAAATQIFGMSVAAAGTHDLVIDGNNAFADILIEVVVWSADATIGTYAGKNSGFAGSPYSQAVSVGSGGYVLGIINGTRTDTFDASVQSLPAGTAVEIGSQNSTASTVSRETVISVLNGTQIGFTWTGGTRQASISTITLEPVASDTTAPVLTSATASVTGQTTATVGCTTDEGDGTLYVSVTTSATQPTSAQIRAGQDHTGAAAVYASSQAISSTGAKTFSATGLTAATSYYAHHIHRDAAGNDSNRLTTSQFTTLPNAPTAPTAGTTDNITASTARFNWSDNSSNETGFRVEIESPSGAGNWALASTAASNPTAANATSLTVNGLAASTEYRMRVRSQNTGGNSSYSTGTAFTTDAGGSGSALMPILLQH